MIRPAALLALAASTTTIITALELTPDTFHKETEGKTVFIKFFAPWCGKYSNGSNDVIYTLPIKIAYAWFFRS